MRRIVFILLAAFQFCAANAQSVQNNQGTFDVSIGGIKAGHLAFSANFSQREYAVTGEILTSGLIGTLSPLTYNATVHGRLQRSGYTPAHYQMTASNGRQDIFATLTYQNGVPRVSQIYPDPPARSYDIDPADQGGTVDPLTGIFALLRDADSRTVCRLEIDLYDGRRRSHVSTSDPVASGEGILCSGEYRRVAGFSPQELAARGAFHFTLYYAAAGGVFRVMRVEAETAFGNAVLLRR